MSTALEDRTEEALSLFVDQDEEGQVDSVVPIRWCISRATAEMIQRVEIENPQLVIVVENAGKEMDRYIVPLEALMCFIRFRRPGHNIVHATIMWTWGGKSVKKVLTKREDNGSYTVDLLDHSKPLVERLEARQRSLESELWEAEEHGDAEKQTQFRLQLEQVALELDAAYESDDEQCIVRYDFSSLKRIDDEAQLGVIVQSEMFAKQPPRLMSWLGNLYGWSRAPRDQCELRRRALITLATLPVSASFLLLVVTGVELFNVLAAAVLLLCGKRNLSLEPVVRPWNHDPRDIWRDQKPSVWWTKKVVEGDGYVRYVARHPVTQVVNPPTVVFSTLIGWMFYLFVGSVLPIIIGFAWTFVLGLLMVIFGSLAAGPISRLNERREIAFRKMREEMQRQAREELRKELEQLACSNASREVSLSALPRDRRTVVLRFQNVKAKVCRPFAS